MARLGDALRGYYGPYTLHSNHHTHGRLPLKAHNSDPRHQINMIADRVSRLLEEADAIKEDVKDIYAEAKGAGFDVAALRAAVAVKRVDSRRSRRGASG